MASFFQAEGSWLPGAPSGFLPPAFPCPALRRALLEGSQPAAHPRGAMAEPHWWRSEQSPVAARPSSQGDQLPGESPPPEQGDQASGTARAGSAVPPQGAMGDGDVAPARGCPTWRLSPFGRGDTEGPLGTLNNPPQGEGRAGSGSQVQRQVRLAGSWASLSAHTEAALGRPNRLDALFAQISVKSAAKGSHKKRGGVGGGGWGKGDVSEWPRHNWTCFAPHSRELGCACCSQPDGKGRHQGRWDRLPRSVRRGNALLGAQQTKQCFHPDVMPCFLRNLFTVQTYACL